MAQPKNPSSVPETMKAIVCTKNGEPKDVLKLTDVPVGKVTKPDHVLVKVLYASINPVDYKMIMGKLGVASPKKPEFIAGRDFSGRVVAKGADPNLKHLKIGDLVYGQCWNQGSFCEYCLCFGKNVQKMPKLMDPMHSASVPLVSQTSYQSILKMKLKKGDKLLILGGSTATGIMAIQIAKNHIECSEVIVTSSQKELCTKLGADRVINYKEEKWQEVLKDYGVDCIYDCVGGQDSWDQCRSEGVIKKNGYYVTIVGDDKHHTETLSVGKLIGTGFSLVNRKFWGAVGNQDYDMLMADSTKNLRDITSLIDNKKLETVIDPDSPYKFEDFLAMFDKSMSHKARGKLLLHIADDDEKANYNDNDEEEKDDIKEEVNEDKIEDKIEDKAGDKEVVNDKDADKTEKVDDAIKDAEEPKEEEPKNEEPKKEEEESPKDDKPSDDQPADDEQEVDKGDDNVADTEQ